MQAETQQQVLMQAVAVAELVRLEVMQQAERWAVLVAQVPLTLITVLQQHIQVVAAQVALQAVQAVQVAAVQAVQATRVHLQLAQQILAAVVVVQLTATLTVVQAA